MGSQVAPALVETKIGPKPVVPPAAATTFEPSAEHATADHALVRKEVWFQLCAGAPGLKKTHPVATRTAGLRKVRDFIPPSLAQMARREKETFVLTANGQSRRKRRSAAGSATAANKQIATPRSHAAVLWSEVLLRPRTLN